MEILGPAPARYDVGGAPLSTQRARVLEQLQLSRSSATVASLAAALGLHTNTIREHLDALVERGMVSRELAPPVGRGRPAGSYTAIANGPASDLRVREYAGLATALAGQLARSSTHPVADALAAGEDWGRSLAVGIPVGTPAQARRRVLSLLTDLGFDPEADARATTARLRRCPLLHAAREHPDIVCPVHLGIVRGALAAVGGDPDRAALLPFSEPGACRLHLHVAGRDVKRSDWHLRAGAVVVAWLIALVAFSFLDLVHPLPPWLLVHLLLLGAVSNAILIWSTHFAAALLRLPPEGSRRSEAIRLGLFNTGALTVVMGMTAGWWEAVLAGALAVATAAAWHAVVLLRGMRRALPSRFGTTVRYYVAAGALLPIGVALGVILAPDDLSKPVHAQVALAHVSINLLGWMGLTVVGTLVTLWPTMLRTRVADGAERAARRALPVLVASPVLIAVAALAGSRAVAVAGILGYLVGLALAGGPFVEEARRRPPTAYATWSVLAGWLWLAGSVAALAVIVATATDWVQAADRADRLAAPLLVGFATQVLLGALSYLIPVVLGGGPSVVRATTAMLDKGGAARVTIVNLGLLAWSFVPTDRARVLSAVLVIGVLALFLPLSLRSVLIARRPSCSFTRSG